ncbi:5'/3'-nucleotidase SurE [Gluconacetobacter takamatsuzukensis]|uniref:5'-nucleotidase SurE n=1 Tax=Gluconacetobacter takamatsuzukensis TaxID=1286190 RepID=A0A7W4PRU7_9PROT|nr:5'/3'-nucleotidase SurE [Gluconacetobacter takamatsuzukensis]MBB2204281.1 5'/3'-nucleotidase SurE [Gluconacetobacter takamatsuzukensis]
MVDGDFIARRILLTNDDGIDAPGLATLVEIAATLAPEIWVVAPERDQSGTSHALSLHDPLRVSERGERRYGVSGTPGDCVVMGVRHLMADQPPDLILSGVNRGANLGMETVFSGTVGAAMTGLLLGIPSIALSQLFTRDQPVRWETARALAPSVIRAMSRLDWARDACLNINFPDRPPAEAGGPVLTSQGAGLLGGASITARTDPRNGAYHWLSLTRSSTTDDEGTETEAVLSGKISITPLRFERTDQGVLGRMRAAPARS